MVIFNETYRRRNAELSAAFVVASFPLVVGGEATQQREPRKALWVKPGLDASLLRTPEESL
jgi:hypothetical protein